MKKLTILLLLISSGTMAQSIQAWVGSPYFVNLANELNYQAGAMFRVSTNNNHFGLGLEYATKNVSTTFHNNYKFHLPQLNLIARYEYQFLLNDKNKLGISAGGTISFMNNNSLEYTLVNEQMLREDLQKGTAIIGRLGFTYYRVLTSRVTLFAEVFGQYKFIQDLPEEIWPKFGWFTEGPRDYISAGLNLGVEINLTK